MKSPSTGSRNSSRENPVFPDISDEICGYHKTIDIDKKKTSYHSLRFSCNSSENTSTHVQTAHLAATDLSLRSGLQNIKISKRFWYYHSLSKFWYFAIIMILSNLDIKKVLILSFSLDILIFWYHHDNIKSWYKGWTIRFLMGGLQDF